ncbi:MAG: ParB/RepB/Spo0J family partition protein [Lachnospiraceae bacterium]|jgi:ParB family chromosome partitioning protein
MSKRNFGEKIKLSSYEDMFGPDEDETIVSAEEKGEIREVVLSDLHSFKNHPFRVIDDENMEELVESIKEYGVLVPAIARPRKEGGFELISGHRRKHASELAGKTTMPVMIKDCDDDEATVIMVDANIQRDDILVSERARAYQMKYEAMKHQGSGKGRSLEAMSEEAGESQKTIQRLICIASLNDDLLKLVDEKKLALRPGLDLSFIKPEEQETVYKVITDLKVTLSTDQSARIKEASRKGFFSEDYLRDILTNEKPKKRKVVFNEKKLDSYFSPEMSNEDIEQVIVQLLEEWKSKGEV